MIEIRSLRDLLRLLFIYQREFKLAALSAVVIIVLGAFLLPAKYESNARLLVKPGRDSTLPIEISNRQALVMPSTQRDPIVDEERLLTGRPIVRQVAERYLEVLANRPPPEGLWKRTKFYVKKAIGAVFDGIRVTLETFGVIEETTAVERLAKDLEKKFEVTHAAGSTVMEISFTWSEPEVAQEVVKAWIEIYMEERTQALGRKSLYAFYEAQTADSAAQIKSYKAQILKHLNEIGASSIEDRLQDLSERINVLRGERFNSIRLIASSDSALVTKYVDDVWPCHCDLESHHVKFLEHLIAQFSFKRSSNDPLVVDTGWTTTEADHERARWATHSNPNVRFFLDRNPEYHKGNGLITVFPITLKNIFTATRRFKRSSSVKRKQHQRYNAASAKVGNIAL